MKEFEIIAKTLFGFEEILAEELRSLGAKDIELLTRAVKYKGDKALLYKSNLFLRTAIKVLKPVTSFEIFNEDQLYQKIQTINWGEYMSVEKTFAIDGIVSSEKFTHSKYVALKAKDAIADQFRAKFGVRPNVDIENPDLRINIHIADTTCSVSLDSSGKSLGKRGYKQSQTAAPLSEVLAAGIIFLSGWDKEGEFIDPMSGSGTIAIEAALIAANMAPGSYRDFNFEKWNDFDSALWKDIKSDAEKKIRPIHARITGLDIDRQAIQIGRENAKRAGVADLVTFKKQDFLKSKPDTENAFLVMNPPYGERLEEKDSMIEFYKSIGDHLKQDYNGADAWIFSGNLEALKFVGLRPSRKIKLYNGPIECRLNKYELYRGSKKASKQNAESESTGERSDTKNEEELSASQRFKRSN